MDDDFSPFTIPQLGNHCAPCSLSYCLYLLGIEATQRALAHAAGIPYKTFLEGMEPPEIKQAARAYKVTATELEIRKKAHGAQFAAKLRRHLERGHPAMLLVYDFRHWIAVLGYTDNKFIIADPDNEDKAFSKWTERTLLDPGNGWNRAGKKGDDQYCTILLKRKDGRPSRWTLTADWLKLCQRGSEEKLTDMVLDLVDIARRAGGIVKRGGIELANVLKEYEGMVPRQVAHWVEPDVSLADLRGLYRDFRVTADALRLRVPHNVDRSRIIAQMTTILSTWVWTEQL